MSPFLSIIVFLGGIAVAIYGIVAASRLLRTNRQRRHEKRSARDMRAFVKSRMATNGQRPGFEGLSAVDPVDTRLGDGLQSSRVLNITRDSK